MMYGFHATFLHPLSLIILEPGTGYDGLASHPGGIKIFQSLQAIGRGSMFGLMKKISSNPDLNFYEKGTNVHLVSNLPGKG